ncbi:MAG: ACT domain-containing protein, partial [Proteobacteria bacterium]
VEVSRGKSILAAVGDNMVSQPGVAGDFLSALGQAGVNIDAIAQGSSERNISVVIDGADSSRALRAVHSAFYLSKQTIGVGLIGAGLIGQEFLKQLQAELAQLRSSFGIDVRVRGIMNSKRMLLDGKDERGVPEIDWLSFAHHENSKSADPNFFINHLNSSHLPHRVIIDATAGDSFIHSYPEWLKSGFHVITPNKKANTQSLDFYNSIRTAEKAGKKRFLYSTNVGAGLPILQTLRELCQTGDRMIRIEGVLSGTLSYIFNTFDGKIPFSEIVKEARKLGFTEPDPRDDLSGTDVARKLVILAREAGQKIELKDIEVESLVPESLRDLSPTEYLDRLSEGDPEMSSELARAHSRSEVLRYVGVIEESGRASVKLASFPRSHAFSGLSGADNIVSFHTTRYRTRPLVIQGPGAGPEVTAAGVFADLLRLASSLGAPR